MHGPFVQLSSGHGLSASAIVFAVALASSESPGLDFPVRGFATRCHAPPILYSSASAPLRT